MSITPKQMSEMDRYTIEEIGIPSIVLMENAKNAFMKHVADYGKYLVLCGTGNNGGDGLAIARDLFLRRKDVTVAILGDPKKGSDDFKTNYNILENLGVRIIDAFEDLDPRDFERDDCIIDAVFGTGLERPVEGKYKEVLDAANESKAYKMAVDIPSGVDGATGEVLGTAFVADLVVTFHEKKKGLDKIKAQVITEKIGIPDSVTEKILGE